MDRDRPWVKMKSLEERPSLAPGGEDSEKERTGLRGRHHVWRRVWEQEENKCIYEL